MTIYVANSKERINNNEKLQELTSYNKREGYKVSIQKSIAFYIPAVKIAIWNNTILLTPWKMKNLGLTKYVQALMRTTTKLWWKKSRNLYINGKLFGVQVPNLVCTFNSVSIQISQLFCGYVKI